MTDMPDLIRRARELASELHELSKPWVHNSDLSDELNESALLLGQLADELERLRNENARLKASTFYECPDCGATCMGRD